MWLTSFFLASGAIHSLRPNNSGDPASVFRPSAPMWSCHCIHCSRGAMTKSVCNFPTWQYGYMMAKRTFFSLSPAVKTKVSQKTKSKWFSLGRSCWTVSWGFLCCRTSKQLLSRSASWATQSFACQEVVGELVVFLVQKWLQFPPLCFSDHEPMECRPWRHQFAVGTCSHKPLQSQISSNLCLSCRWGHRAANHPRSPDNGVVKGVIITRGGPVAGSHQTWQCLEGRDLYSASWNLYQPTNPSENAEFWASKPPLLVVPAAALRISVGWGNLPDEWDNYKTARRNLEGHVGYSPSPSLSLSNQKEALTNLQVCLSVYLYAPNHKESQSIYHLSPSGWSLHVTIADTLW